ncbi:MAG: hypothetical protein MAG715_00593 [Methanonatronarchaeales archaeon]|nr:hypothetical protein [Methanonatronarchaeales archaeon]
MAMRVGRVALASVAGVTDPGFAETVPGIGMACVGGYSLDGPTRRASREIAKRGRDEFGGVTIEGLADEASSSGVPCVVNARSVSVEPLLRLADGGVAVEINAHCRQPEMVEVGAGEALLLDPEGLSSWVDSVKVAGGVVGVKTRANVVDDGELAASVEPHFLHVDAVGPGGYDLDAIRVTRENFDGVILGNNSVRGVEDAEAMMDAGADVVSAARPALTEPSLFAKLAEALEPRGEVVIDGS